MNFKFNKMKQEDIAFIEENIIYFKTNRNPMSAFWFRLFDIANYIKDRKEYTDIGCGRCLKSVKDFCYSQYKQNGGLL
jgi:hypothetical protein